MGPDDQPSSLAERIAQAGEFADWDQPIPWDWLRSIEIDLLAAPLYVPTLPDGYFDPTVPEVSIGDVRLQVARFDADDDLVVEAYTELPDGYGDDEVVVTSGGDLFRTLSSVDTDLAVIVNPDDGAYELDADEVDQLAVRLVPGYQPQEYLFAPDTMLVPQMISDQLIRGLRVAITLTGGISRAWAVEIHTPTFEPLSILVVDGPCGSMSRSSLEDVIDEFENTVTSVLTELDASLAVDFVQIATPALAHQVSLRAPVIQPSHGLGRP